MQYSPFIFMGEGALWKKRPFFCAPCRKTFLWRDGLLISDERRWWNDSILPHPVGSAGIAKNRQLIAKIVSFFLRVLCLYRDHSQMLTEVRHEYDHERKTACPPPLLFRLNGARRGSIRSHSSSGTSRKSVCFMGRDYHTF